MAGALAGWVAGIVALPLLQFSGATPRLAAALGGESWTIQLAYCVAAMLAGIVYAVIFGRAANDRRGGWLFGIAFGFLLWMIGPVALLQIFVERQLVTGIAAMGVLGANLVSGLVLGVIFRPIYTLVRKPLVRHAAQPTVAVKESLP
jgi:hypothetical protein